MHFKSDLTHLGDRIAKLGSRFEEKVSPRRGKGDSAKRHGLSRTLYWNLRDLFTQGVSKDAIRDMVRREVRDTFQFFARDLDLEALRPLPCYKRYIATAWKSFGAPLQA